MVDGVMEQQAARLRALQTGDTTWPMVALAGVTELRVHGIGGTPAPQMLDVADPVQVSGDAMAGMWRGPDRPNGGGPHHVEAYAWGGLTGRSFRAAVWLLVLPFALVNLAGWMAPRRDAGAFRGLVRVAGLGVTLLYVLFAAAASMDFLAYQCAGAPTAGGDAGCRAAGWWLIGTGGVAHAPDRRVALGAAGPLLLIALLWAATHVSRRRYDDWRPSWMAGSQGSADGPAQQGLTDKCFWTGQGYAEKLAEVHIGTAFAVVAYLIAAADRGLAAPAARPWATGLMVAAGLAGAAGVLLAAVSRWRQQVARYIPSGVGLGLVVLAGVTAWPDRATGHPGGALPGLALAFDVVVGLLLVSVTALGVAALLHPKAAGSTRLSRKVRLRLAITPYTVVALAAVLTLVTLSGSVLWFARLLGRAGVSGASAGSGAPPVLRYGQAYIVLARALPLLLLVFAGGALLAATLVVLSREKKAIDRLTAEWEVLERPPGWVDGCRDDDGNLLTRVLRALRLPAALLDIVRWALWICAAVFTPCIAILTGIWVVRMSEQGWATERMPGGLPEITPLPLSVCVWLLVAVPVAGIYLLRQALVKADVRRKTAMAWDVLTFWPRSFHPLAPPSYAERAVPEIQTRLLRLLDAGEPDDPSQVLLLGHSQGSVLVAAALASLPRRPGDDLPHRLAVITYGCPLTHLYSSSFPAYFDLGTLGRTAARVQREGDQPGWSNAWRDTDPIGVGEVVAHADSDENWLLVENVYLPDPPAPWHPHGDERPQVRGHAERGYRLQREFVSQVDAELRRLRGDRRITRP